MLLPEHVPFRGLAQVGRWVPVPCGGGGTIRFVVQDLPCGRIRCAMSATYATVFFFFPLQIVTFHSQAQLVRDFALSALLDKPWSQASSPRSPGYERSLLLRLRLSISTFFQFFDARRFSSNFAKLTLSRIPLVIFFDARYDRGAPLFFLILPLNLGA